MQLIVDLSIEACSFSVTKFSVQNLFRKKLDDSFKDVIVANINIAVFFTWS
jgi:hypothetical protein